MDWMNQLGGLLEQYTGALTIALAKIAQRQYGG